MKKILSSSVLALSGLVLFSGVALATETEEEAKAPKVNSSDLSIEFAKPKPNEGVGPYANSLSFTFAPKAFAFGQQTADLSNNKAYDLTSADAGKQFVVVNDDRQENTGRAWIVKVKMAPITDTEAGSTKTVDGALTLNLDAVQHYAMGTKTDEATGLDVDPAEPNDMQLDPINGLPTNTPVVQDWADVDVDAPTDVKLGTEAVALKGTSVEVAPTGAEETIIQKTTTPVGATGVKAGYATKIAKSSIKFTNVDASAIGKTFATKLTWTLTRDITP